MGCYPFQVVSRMVMNRSGDVFYIGGNDVLPAYTVKKNKMRIQADSFGFF